MCGQIGLDYCVLTLFEVKLVLLLFIQRQLEPLIANIVRPLESILGYAMACSAARDGGTFSPTQKLAACGCSRVLPVE